ncbi:hypothetical protein M409DRAFT_55746 [Zasmidium cellare ATCC 36951]|uniref:Uncharacterized protein n=1 Tax=Zasmidium cellare ATCC 36951 TaxID=1080233 RepID=A0A6A6CHB5_ZASCE|nr:uncharacterized protein M409DRAFT_55746 [Zasmidium cellare ATCC 36951]KAF2165332.1 hypothetical protein M409DRAFT_55746 [Zasmidium cellare ATCC 36951]
MSSSQSPRRPGRESSMKRKREESASPTSQHSQHEGEDGVVRRGFEASHNAPTNSRWSRVASSQEAPGRVVRAPSRRYGQRRERWIFEVQRRSQRGPTQRRRRRGGGPGTAIDQGRGVHRQHVLLLGHHARHPRRRVHSPSCHPGADARETRVQELAQGRPVEPCRLRTVEYRRRGGCGVHREGVSAASGRVGIAATPTLGDCYGYRGGIGNGRG